MIYHLSAGHHPLITFTFTLVNLFFSVKEKCRWKLARWRWSLINIIILSITYSCGSSLCWSNEWIKKPCIDPHLHEFVSSERDISQTLRDFISLINISYGFTVYIYMYTLGSPPMHIYYYYPALDRVCNSGDISYIPIPFHLLIEADLGPIFVFRSSSTSSAVQYCIMNVKSWNHHLFTIW